MTQVKNAICWFEIYVDDMERAKRFYSAVLGIQFQDTPAPDDSDDLKMSLFPSEPDPQKMAVSGALVQMKGARGNGECMNTNTIVYFPCDDCSVEESRVIAAGGQVHRSKFSIGEFGFCAICLDTENNTFGLYSMK